MSTTASTSTSALASASTFELIADELLARVAGGGGTPTIILNGWRLPGAPDSARLHRYISVLLAGGGLDTVTVR